MAGQTRWQLHLMMTLQAITEEAFRWEIFELEIGSWIAVIPGAVLAKKRLLPHGFNAPALTIDHLQPQWARVGTRDHEGPSLWSHVSDALPIPLSFQSSNPTCLSRSQTDQQWPNGPCHKGART